MSELTLLRGYPTTPWLLQLKQTPQEGQETRTQRRLIASCNLCVPVGRTGEAARPTQQSQAVKEHQCLARTWTSPLS